MNSLSEAYLKSIKYRIITLTLMIPTYIFGMHLPYSSLKTQCAFIVAKNLHLDNASDYEERLSQDLCNEIKSIFCSLLIKEKNNSTLIDLISLPPSAIPPGYVVSFGLPIILSSSIIWENTIKLWNPQNGMCLTTSPVYNPDTIRTRLLSLPLTVLVQLQNNYISNSRYEITLKELTNLKTLP